MKNFIKSIACSRRVHCTACLTDPIWRALMKAPDVCPFGSTLEEPLEAIDVEGRHATCAVCCYLECNIKHYTDCRAKAVLARPNFQCPNGKFGWKAAKIIK